MDRPPFTYLEHTADVGVRAFGDDVRELFSNAARGMFSLICASGEIRPVETREIELAEEDPAYLLADWLEELLFRFSVDRFLFADFQGEVGDGRVVGKALGETYDPGRHELDTEIKAVTYHGLKVERSGDIWTAEVIFDI